MAESILIDPGATARIQTEKVLDTPFREGARRLLQEALELEVQDYIDRFEQRGDVKGHRIRSRGVDGGQGPQGSGTRGLWPKWYLALWRMSSSRRSGKRGMAWRFS